MGEIDKLKSQIDLLENELLKAKSFEFKTEKKIGFYVRAVLRLMAWGILMFYMIYRIIIPVISKEPLYLDTNDGWVMGICMALLLAIEAVKAASEKWLNSKLN